MRIAEKKLVGITDALQIPCFLRIFQENRSRIDSFQGGDEKH
jgi:hypothetical protein